MDDGSPVGAGSLACAWVARTASLMMDGSSLPMVSFTIASRLVGHEFPGHCSGSMPAARLLARSRCWLPWTSHVGTWYPGSCFPAQCTSLCLGHCSRSSSLNCRVWRPGHCSGDLGAADGRRLGHCSRGSGHGHPVLHAGHCSGAWGTALGIPRRSSTVPSHDMPDFSLNFPSPAPTLPFCWVALTFSGLWMGPDLSVSSPWCCCCELVWRSKHWQTDCIGSTCEWKWLLCS